MLNIFKWKNILLKLSSKMANGRKLMLIMSWYTIGMSIFWVFATDIAFVSDFQGYTGISFADYTISSPTFANIYIITKKLVGLMILTSGVLTLLITHYSYGKGEKWSWYALLSVAILLWGSLIGYRVYIGYVAPSMVTFLLGFILNIIGLALPAREFLGKE